MPAIMLWLRHAYLLIIMYAFIHLPPIRSRTPNTHIYYYQILLLEMLHIFCILALILYFCSYSSPLLYVKNRCSACLYSGQLLDMYCLSCVASCPNILEHSGATTLKKYSHGLAHHKHVFIISPSQPDPYQPIA